ncbi:MAG: AAA family ATPase [Anaerotignum sp.]|nr:AAA family ATPase [Anaerotignum sp.]
MGREKEFKFVIPEVKTELVGTQGEKAEFMSYCLDEDITMESILAELRRQPHMAGLADYISTDRKIYLLEGDDLEVLQLAASYIASYHRLWDACIGDEEVDNDYDDEIDEWENGDVNQRVFDFNSNIPYLTVSELLEVYSNAPTPGFGGWMYREEKKMNRPWWTMSEIAPIIIYSTNSLNCMPNIFRAMQRRELVILLQHKRESPFGGRYFDDDDDMLGVLMNLESLSFELETEMIRLPRPENDGDYKKQILRQLAKAKGEGLASPSEAGKILSMILQSRGNVTNQTISKAISNAYMRRKRTGKLTAKDFEYLSAFRTKEKKMESKRGAKMELVGQEDVRAQLERFVKSMLFQKKRMEMGLPYENIHYTFAFMGAPGTGKTTWAMRLAEEMKEHGLLENTESICINAAELKAKYVGHTTGKVKALFEQYGVIILDEAYSLTEGDNQDAFGAEALAQLCVELENHGTDRLVIFAGYGGSNNKEDNRMLQFLQSNPGISSRISFKVHFDNFQPEELVQVFHTMMKYNGYETDHTTDQMMEEMFRHRMKERAFGNCREVRNLMDRVKIQMAERLMESQDYTRETAVKVLDEDIRKAACEIMNEVKGLTQKKGIGF